MQGDHVYFVHIGYIPRTSSVKLYIARHYSEKEFNFLTNTDMSVPTNTIISAGTVPRLSSSLRDLRIGKLFLLFL